MTDLPRAKVVKKPRITLSLVWIVPILCLVLVALLGLSQLPAMGPKIIIDFDTADALVVGKTEIKYLGVRVGKVTAVHMNEDRNGVEVSARLTRAAAPL